MDYRQRLAKRIDAGLGPNGQAVKQEFVAMIGEYIGTTMFLFMGFGGAHTANLPAAAPTENGKGFIDTSNLLYIALTFGMSLVINVWIFFRISGALFNPAIALALVVTGIMPPLRAALLVISQILGGITAAGLIYGLMPGPLNVSTTLADGVSIPQGLFLEMFLTSQLVLMVFFLGVEKHKSTFLAPVAIGLTLFVCHLCGIHFTGAGLNPARSFGPHVVVGDFPGYHWIYWVGPFLGGLVSAGVYTLMKVLHYEKVNGDQDRDDTVMLAHLVERESDVTVGGAVNGYAGEQKKALVAEVKAREDETGQTIA